MADDREKDMGRRALDAMGLRPSPSSPPPPAVSGHTEGTAFTVFDYLGLGFILEPPAVLGQVLMIGETSLKWSMLAYGVPSVIIGAICIYIGRHWNSIKLRWNAKLVRSVEVSSSSYLALLIIFVLFLSGIAILPIIIWPPSENRPPASLPSSTAETKTPAIAPPKADEPKSPLLGLNDAGRWQMLTKFYDTVNSSGGVKCQMRLQLEKQSQAALQLWNELQPILYYAGWHIQASSDQTKMFHKGMTITAGVDKGEPLVCAIRLEQLVDSANSKIPVTIMQNQVSKDLQECNNECIEILFGDFN